MLGFLSSFSFCSSGALSPCDYKPTPPGTTHHRSGPTSNSDRDDVSSLKRTPTTTGTYDIHFIFTEIIQPSFQKREIASDGRVGISPSRSYRYNTNNRLGRYITEKVFDTYSLMLPLTKNGNIGWHCQLTTHGDPNLRVSSLVWCSSGSCGLAAGRLFSSSIDGSISEWDLYNLTQKVVVGPIGVFIWQMAANPLCNQQFNRKPDLSYLENGHAADRSIGDGDVTSDSEVEADSLDVYEEPFNGNAACVAIACDDGCVRIYDISYSDQVIYHKSLPRVSGRVLSVTWSWDAKRIYSGSSDGFIRCWDAKSSHEVYRITVGLGGLGGGSELCIWSLLALRCGTLVSADSSGSVQNGRCNQVPKPDNMHICPNWCI